nr:LAGLIDADG family homing endonuclease [Natronomonas sp. LN261]
MSGADPSADELTLPIKRTTGETMADRLTGNAYHNILPARYLRKDADGEPIEQQEELFERVARNVALAEAVFEAGRRGVDITVTPDQLKPDHPRRDALAAEVFGAGVTTDADAETTLSVYNVNKFAYETLVPELPEAIRSHVEETADAFREQMERLSFMPNSPTLMNAGDELQQLSACFVDSPEDDIDDIHQTAKEAAEVFQCLTAETSVHVEQKGVTSIADVEPGDEIVQRDGGDHRSRRVEEIHAYDDAPTMTITTEGGIDVRGTPNHRLLVDGDWKRLDEIRAGDTVSVRLGWLPEEAGAVELEPVEAGPQWAAERTVSNESVVELHAQGLCDYAIADRLDSSPSTIQRRRADELDLPANGSGGRDGGPTFDEERFRELHADGHTDSEIADALGVHSTTVRNARMAQSLSASGQAVKSVSQPETLSTDLAELLGLWIGDGSVHEDGIRFHVSREETLEHVDRLARRSFDTGADWTWADGCYEVVIYSHEIKRFWLRNFGDAKPSSSEATVPEPVLGSDRDRVYAFLRGLFSADGTLSQNRYPRLYSASEELVDGVHQLLLGVGIPSTIWAWDDDERDYYSVAPTDERGLSEFASHVGFVDDRSETMTASIADAELEPTTCGTVRDAEWTQEIVAIEESDPATVYDVTVEGNHEYVANSVVSHNSGGGMGYAFWRLRPYGDAVGSTGGIASGPITFMRTYDQMCETIAQGGARRGAQMGVMRISHPDVIQFIHAKNKDVSLAETLRLNDPDDFTHNSFEEALAEARELIDDEGKVPEHLRNAVEGHLSNFNISVGVTDGFMEALKAGEEYTFTNPRTGEPHVATPETKELYDMFGLGEHVDVGETLSVPAEKLWEHVLEGAHENGEPGVVYLERINKEHSFDVEEHPDHRILATNPCLTGDMEVQLSDGTTRQIGELADEECRITVRTLDDGGVTSSPATAFKTKKDADVVRIETESGPTIRTTPDHKIRSADGTWVKAQDLDTGDDIVGLSQLRATPQGPVQETATETVVEVGFDGTEDVYDMRVEGTHNFFASESGKKGINVHNCGEQPLEEYEACNLGHINLSTLADLDAPDWRVWYDDHGEAYADLEAAVDAFLEEALDFEAFDERIELGTRFLENVVTMSDFPVPEIEQKVREMRKIGLGVMGLAQLYIQLGIEYGSEEGNEVARQMMRHINHGSKWASHELAEERGVFEEWDNSKYADPTEYREWFEKQTGLDADEWEDGFAIRNHNTTTIAPTGTTSMIGNTTGGCEPIYNVAYYKNVSDDVQGDEMLVEFDDYFLRALEENGLDVEAVKQEAQEQMAANEFDGIDGLSTVPDAIGELFVTTGALSAKEHAGVQVACQEGVDSAISKTVNAPNDSTIEDAKEVFEYIYDHGGKGVTYYRDGTRSKQVLTTRAKNTEFADEAEAAEAIVEDIEEIFGGIEGFLDSEEVAAVLDGDVRELLDVSPPELGTKQARPDVLHGVTQRIDTGYGKLYVNINENPENGRPFELFANIGNSGGFTASFTEALAKTISTALRSGVDPREIADELQGIRSPKVAWDKGEQINSIPDAIGTAMRRYLDGEVDKAYPQQQSLSEIAEEETEQSAVPPETDGGAVSDSGIGSPASPNDDTDAARSLIDAGESPECPECGSMTLYYSEGCKTCESCGWSEC